MTLDARDGSEAGAPGLEVGPQAHRHPGANPSGEGFASIAGRKRVEHPESRQAAELLVDHLFAPVSLPVSGIDYAIEYHLAEGRAGGDLVDVYAFNNASVSFTVADIAGKGARAAIQAALVKYGLRAYASEGFNPEKVVASLDRLYLEHTAFERTESFATVFFGHLDADRAVLTYCSAGHESVILAERDTEPVVLDVTAPAVGLFEDRQHLFKQRNVPMPVGTVLVAVTDGITESRRGSQEFFGIERFRDVVREQRDAGVDELARTLVERALDFSDRAAHDDIAVLALRVTGPATF